MERKASIYFCVTSIGGNGANERLMVRRDVGDATADNAESSNLLHVADATASVDSTSSAHANEGVNHVARLTITDTNQNPPDSPQNMSPQNDEPPPSALQTVSNELDSESSDTNNVESETSKPSN